MKKRFILLTLLFIHVFSPLFSQTGIQNPELKVEVKKTEVYAGISGSINSTWIIYQQTYGEPFLDYQITIRPAVNVQVGYDWNFNWGIRGEIGYAMLGQKYKGTQVTIPATRDIKSDYLQFPVLIKYRTWNKNVHFFAMTGVQLNLLLSSKQTYLRNGEVPPAFNGIQVGAEDISDRNTAANLGFRLDAGMDVILSTHFYLNVALSNMLSVTHIVASAWRMNDYRGQYHSSHNLYSGLNAGINYIF